MDNETHATPVVNSKEASMPSCSVIGTRAEMIASVQDANRLLPPLPRKITENEEARAQPCSVIGTHAQMVAAMKDANRLLPPLPRKAG